MAPGASLSFQLSQDQGAAFLTRHNTLCLDSSQDGTLRKYIKDHYSAWGEYARYRGFEEVDLILISGIDLSRDYAMLAYATGDYRFSAQVTADIPAVASAWADVWATSTNVGPTHFNWGPDEPTVEQPTSPLSQPPEATTQPSGSHITFVRGWRMKRRIILIPTKLKAEAEPSDMDGFPDRGGTFEGDVVAVSNTPEVCVN